MTNQTNEEINVKGKHPPRDYLLDLNIECNKFVEMHYPEFAKSDRAHFDLGFTYGAHFGRGWQAEEHQKIVAELQEKLDLSDKTYQLCRENRENLALLVQEKDKEISTHKDLLKMKDNTLNYKDAEIKCLIDKADKLSADAVGILHRRKVKKLEEALAEKDVEIADLKRVADGLEVTRIALESKLARAVLALNSSCDCDVHFPDDPELETYIKCERCIIIDEMRVSATPVLADKLADK